MNSTNPAQHTPTPLYIEVDSKDGGALLFHDADGPFGYGRVLVAKVIGLNLKQGEEFAAFIVRACNNHERLVGMLGDAAMQLDRLTGPSLEVYARTFAALARAAINAEDSQ